MSKLHSFLKLAAGLAFFVGTLWSAQAEEVGRFRYSNISIHSKSAQKMPIARSICIIVNSSATNSLSFAGDIYYVIHPESDAYRQLVRFVSKAAFLHRIYSPMVVDGNVMAFDIRLDGFTNRFEMVFLSHHPRGKEWVAEPNSLLRDIREMVQNYNACPASKEVRVISTETGCLTNSPVSWNAFCDQFSLLNEQTEKKYFRLDNSSGEQPIRISFMACGEDSLLAEVFDEHTHTWVPQAASRDADLLTIPVGQSVLLKVFPRPNRLEPFELVPTMPSPATNSSPRASPPTPPFPKPSSALLAIPSIHSF